MIKINKSENDPNKPYRFDDYEQLFQFLNTDLMIMNN